MVTISKTQLETHLRKSISELEGKVREAKYFVLVAEKQIEVLQTLLNESCGND